MSSHPRGDHRVHKALGLLQNLMSQTITIRDLAQSVALSPRRLEAVFKAQTGMSPKRYLRTLRLDKAYSLLETTDLIVKEVAAQVGWKDVSHFVRDFESRFGQSPRTVRDHIRGKAHSGNLGTAWTSTRTSRR
jgi:transcriptional regulator GlxA family with amidase domain